MTKIDTFSANSLKVLDKSIEEFIDKYEYNLNIFKKDERAILGQKYHNLICAYIKGFDIEKMKKELNENQKEIFEKFLSSIKEKKEGFFETEYSFLTKDEIKDHPYYLTGRFDALYKDDSGYIIHDWKTLNLPKNPKDDLQTIVYLYCGAKLFKTKNLKIRYLSIEKLEYADVEYEDEEIYKNRIEGIIGKYFKI